MKQLKNSTKKSHKTHKPKTNFFFTSFLLSVLWKEPFFNCSKSLVSRIKELSLNSVSIC